MGRSKPSVDLRISNCFFSTVSCIQLKFEVLIPFSTLGLATVWFKDPCHAHGIRDTNEYIDIGNINMGFRIGAISIWKI